MPEVDLVSVQCRQADKEVFERARLVFGSFPEVMAAAAAAIAQAIDGEETLQAKRARIRARLTGSVSKGPATPSNTPRPSSKVRKSATPSKVGRTESKSLEPTPTPPAADADVFDADAIAGA